MLAKEMFKKLGYKQKVNDDIINYYFKTKTYTKSIEFSILSKDICFYGSYAIDTTKDKNQIYRYTNLIDTNLLQAINKQVEELGWNKLC